MDFKRFVYNVLNCCKKCKRQSRPQSGCGVEMGGGEETKRREDQINGDEYDEYYHLNV